MALTNNPFWITYDRICKQNELKASLEGFRQWLIANNLPIPSVLKIQIIVYKRSSQISSDGWNTKKQEGLVMPK